MATEISPLMAPAPSQRRFTSFPTSFTRIRYPASSMFLSGWFMALQIADRWFELQRCDADIPLLWEPHVVPLMRCNIWHVRGRDRDLLIDTGMGVASLREAERHLLEKAVLAVATHTHLDHVGGHHEFDECLVHRLEADGLGRSSDHDSLDTSEWDAADI